MVLAVVVVVVVGVGEVVVLGPEVVVVFEAATAGGDGAEGSGSTVCGASGAEAEVSAEAPSFLGSINPILPTSAFSSSFVSR